MYLNLVREWLKSTQNWVENYPCGVDQSKLGWIMDNEAETLAYNVSVHKEFIFPSLSGLSGKSS